MKSLAPRTFLLLALWAAALVLRAAPALACAVCYGDPNSPMVKGANAGVVVLLIVIVGVLTWVGSMMIFFVRRARRLAGPE